MKQNILDKEYGIVLEGGGARGAYQIGVWKALREIGIKIKGVVGTSVGALNGALIVQGDFELGYDVWNNITYSQVVNFDDDIINKISNFSIKKSDINHVKETFKNIMKNYGLDITPLKHMIRQVIKEDKVRNSNIEYGLVTVSLSDMKPLELFLDDIEEGLLADFLLASSYLPVFKTEKLHGKLYIDGGFYDNAPKKMLINRGYKDIIVIKIHGVGVEKKIKADKDVKIITIEPKEPLGGILEFSKETARNNLKLGYYDTLKMFKELKGNDYYIELNKNENYYMHKFLKIPKKIKRELIDAFGVKNIPDNRNIIEYVLPRLAKKIGLKKDWNYSDLLIGIYEYLATDMDIEKFKIYSLEEFSQMVNINTKNIKEINILDKLFDKNTDEIIRKLGKTIKTTAIKV